MSNVAGIILAGGKSSRMGKDKNGLLHQGQPLLHRMKMLLQQAGIESVYVSHATGITDTIKNKGPLGGVHATLEALQNTYDFLLYLPVDMPDLTPALLQQLLAASNHAKAVRFEDYMLPFRLKTDAVSSQEIEITLKETAHYSLHTFQEGLDVLKLPVHVTDATCFANINTPDEWQKYTEEPL